MSHIDFHFGSADTKGSEHEMDGKQSPMEMQMVFFKSKFDDHNAALASTDKDALATISQLFSVDKPSENNLVIILTPCVGRNYYQRRPYSDQRRDQ